MSVVSPASAAPDEVSAPKRTGVGRLDPASAPQTSADRFMLRLLRIDLNQRALNEAELRTSLSTSLLVSATRCLLTYIFIPLVVPLIGWMADVGPLVGLPLAVVAITFNIRTTRRFWRALHRYRWHYTALSTTVEALLVYLAISDAIALLGR